MPAQLTTLGYVLVALVTIGVLLIVFGGLVLLRFPDRPGGQIEFHGAKINSAGAGLPLIVLGLTAVVLAALSGGTQPQPTAAGPTTIPAGASTDQRVTTTTPTPAREVTTTVAPPSSASCINEHLDKEPAVPEHLRTRLPEGQTAQIIGSPGTAALVLMQNTEVTGAVRLLYQPIGEPTLTVIDVVDGSCQLGTSTVQSVRNGFTVMLTLPDRQYRLEISYGTNTASRALPKATLTRTA
jgi:hypothetical protein